jgi:hypothetical protein
VATKLRFPQGSSSSYLLKFLRPDGAVESLDGASFAAYLKRSVFDADADALVDISRHDFQAGLAVLSFFPADTADLDPFLSCEWQVRATLGDGRVYVSAYHQGQLVFAPLPGDSQMSEPPNDYIEKFTPEAMSNYIRNLYELSGLTGGGSTKLDGLSAATLAAMPNGTQVELHFTGSIGVRYRLRDLEDGEVEVGAAAGGFLIVANNDTTRAWELCAVTKEGQPCVWNTDTTLWHQQLAQGTGTGVAPALAQEADGFSLPT